MSTRPPRAEAVGLGLQLPKAADAALRIVRKLRDAGHAALLAGGCVRDLLLGLEPKDYDVATDATPERVTALLKPTRQVGAQFGVVLARSLGRWVEVATFRCDGQYVDGRRPERVTFGDARADALRRDFTINGMFFDPLSAGLIDYVGGQADLGARLVRAIGEPGERFGEDHLRLLRAVRIAARLEFAIEARTLEAMRAQAHTLARVAAERVRDELEKMLAHAARARAFGLLADNGLLEHLWRGASWTAAQSAAARALLAALPAEATFELGMLALLAGRGAPEIEDVCRALTCSNEQRECVLWLAAHAADLDQPDAIALAALKRLMANTSFAQLRQMAELRYRTRDDASRLLERLTLRLAAIPEDAVAPPPLVTGADLQERAIPAGPIYKRVLDAVYTAQLDGQVPDRAAALRLLDELLATG